MTRRLVALLLQLLLAGAVGAGEARYLVVGNNLPVEVDDNGYVLHIEEHHPGAAVVRVTTSLAPFGVQAPYTGPSLVPGTPVPRGFTLPGALAEELRRDTDAWQAATRVLEWVSRHLELEEDDQRAQDAASVLSRGSGRCSGLANATAALLLTAGFEAHTVSGLLVSDEGPIPHRWVSCRLPGAGWVATDPTLGLWLVSPRHLAFADTVTEIPSVQILELQEQDLSVLPRRGSLAMRPNLGSSLLCRLETGSEPAADVWVTLAGGDGSAHRARLAPEARFELLLPGRWTMLVCTADGSVIQRVPLELEAGVAHSVTVRLPPS